MSKLFLLTKIQLKQLANALFSRSVKNNKKIPFILPFIFPIALSLYMGGVMSLSFSAALSVEEMYFLPLSIMLTYAGLMVMLSMYQINSHLYKNKDFELLASLPLTKEEIFTSKLLSLYCYQLIYSIFMMIIPSFIYLQTDFSIIRLLTLLVTTLVLPIIPMILSIILGTIVAYISSKFKNMTIITIVLYVVLIAGIMLGTNKIAAIFESFDAILFMNALKKYWVSAYYVVLALKNNDLLYFGLSIIYTIVPFIIVIIIFSRAFDSINKAIRKTKKSKERSLTSNEYVMNSYKKTLFMREVKHYIHSPMYVLNTIVGPLMLIIGAVGMLFIEDEMLQQLLKMKEFGLILIASIALMLLIMSTTAASISLEGHSIYLLKSLPIEPIDIFRAKIKLNIYMQYGLTLIALIIYTFVNKPSIPLLVLSLIFTFICSLYSSYIGIIVNLFHPMLDYTNEAVVVKQSASVLISMLAGFASVIIFGFVGYMLLNITSNVEMVIVIICAIMVGCIRYFEHFLQTKGIDLFNRL